MKNLIVNSGLNLPRMLTLMITNRCNLNCLHCWPESGLAGDCSHVDRKKLMKVIGEFRRLGTEKVCLTGGEPLLHPHWFDILSFCCVQPGINQVFLQTNATLLTKEHVRKLASFTHDKLIIQVSLEGSSIGVHDKIRGAGSFTRAWQGLTLLAENDLAPQTRVSLTETEDNFQEIPALLESIHSLGITQFVSGTLVNGGRAAKADDKGLKPPMPFQYEKILHQFHTDPSFKELYGKMANIAPLEWYFGKSTSAVPGCEFIRNPYITAGGTLFPCRMFQIDTYAVHDIYSRPIVETLQKIIPKWTVLQQLSQHRPENLQTCRACPARSHCRGGCMGRAYMAHGALMTIEDRCELRRVVYGWPGSRKPLSACDA